MHLSYNTNGLQMDIFEAIRYTAEAGYQGIELAFDDDVFHPYRINTAMLDQILAHTKNYRLRIAAITDGCADLLGRSETFEPSLVSLCEEDRTERITLLRRCVEIAEYLECPVLNLVSGRKQEGIADAESMLRLKDSILRLLDASSKITFAVEPEPGMVLETTDQAIELIRGIDSERVRVNMDIGHVKCSEEPYLEKIKKAAPYAVHCHIEDILGKTHEHLIPGDGDLDFRSVFRILESSGYAGFLSVELYPQVGMWKEALHRSITHLQSEYEKRNREKQRSIE